MERQRQRAANTQTIVKYCDHLAKWWRVQSDVRVPSRPCWTTIGLALAIPPLVLTFVTFVLTVLAVLTFASDGTQHGALWKAGWASLLMGGNSSPSDRQHWDQDQTAQAAESFQIPLIG